MSSPWESHRDRSSEPGDGPPSGSGSQDGPMPYSPPTVPGAVGARLPRPGALQRPVPVGPVLLGRGAYGPNPYGPPTPYPSGNQGPAPYGQAPYGQSQYGQYSQNQYGQNQYGQNQYGQPYGAAPYAQAHPPTRPVSGLAIAALVCGIVGFFTAGLASIPAVICGHMAWRETSSGTHSGHGMAIAGLALGYLQILGWALFWLIVVGSVATV